MLQTLVPLLLLLGPALAQWEGREFYGQPKQYQQINTCPGGGKAGTMRVTGSQEQSSKADQATIDMSISVTRANSTSEASNSTLDTAGKVIQALTSEPNAVDQNDISTEAVRIAPSHGGKGAEPTTFNYTLQISVKVVNVTNEVLADVLNSAIAAGNKSLSINSIKFSLSEAKRNMLKQLAQKQAIKNAKDKALRVAKELGVTISHIINVQDDPSSRFLGPDARKVNDDPVGGGKQQGAPPVMSAKPRAPVTVGTEIVKSTMRITYGICNTANSVPASAGSP